MSTPGSEIAVVSPRDYAESKSLSKDLAMSSLMPIALRKKPEDVLAVVLAGAELGLAPMQAIRGIHIIDGKVSLSSGLMVALVKRSAACEYFKLIESTDRIATYETRRRGDPEPTRMSFTIQNAQTAGLLSKTNHQKYPAAMLRARCEAAICRAVYPDVCLGLYDSDTGEIEPEERQVSTQQAHVEQVKADLRRQVQPEITDAEIVEPAELVAAYFLGRIANAKTTDELAALGPDIRALGDADREAIKPAYRARQAELSKA